MLGDDLRGSVAEEHAARQSRLRRLIPLHVPAERLNHLLRLLHRLEVLDRPLAGVGARDPRVGDRVLDFLDHLIYGRALLPHPVGEPTVEPRPAASAVLANLGEPQPRWRPWP